VLTRSEAAVVERVDVVAGETLHAGAGTWLVLGGRGHYAGGELVPGSQVSVAHGDIAAITSHGADPLVLVAVTPDGV